MSGESYREILLLTGIALYDMENKGRRGWDIVQKSSAAGDHASTLVRTHDTFGTFNLEPRRLCIVVVAPYVCDFHSPLFSKPLVLARRKEHASRIIPSVISTTHHNSNR